MNLTPTTSPSISPPESDESFSYYHQYIAKAPADDFLTAFQNQADELRQLLGRLPPGRDSVIDPPFSWTLKQVVGHLIDVERIFSYRMLRIAVGDQTPIPGYEQDLFVANLNYESVSMSSLFDEFSLLRKANVLLVKRLSTDALIRKGTASGHSISARANLFILSGHFVHHMQILQKRLLSEPTTIQNEGAMT